MLPLCIEPAQHWGSTVPAPSQSQSTTQPKKLRPSVAGRRRKQPVRLAPLTARDAYIDVGTKMVADPSEYGSFTHAPFNRRVDVLEEEISNRRISTSQYEIGRIIQAVFERASGARLGSGRMGEGGSRDQTIANELKVIYAIEDAATVRRYVSRIERVIGTVGARFLRQILADGTTFAQYAEARGKGGERGRNQIGEHFRLLLEGLDDAWAARGAAIFEEDAKGEVHPRILAQRAQREATETNERGCVVPQGQGYRWGRRARD